MHWKVEFFKDRSGGEPVKKWLDALSDEVRGKVLARVHLLEQHGPTLDFPYTSQVEGKLREIRLRFGKTRYRVLYFFDDDRVGILLHGFTKDSDAIEEADKRVGRSNMQDHNERVASRKSHKKK